MKSLVLNDIANRNSFGRSVCIPVAQLFVVWKNDWHTNWIVTKPSMIRWTLNMGNVGGKKPLTHTHKPYFCAMSVIITIIISRSALRAALLTIHYYRHMCVCDLCVFGISTHNRTICTPQMLCATAHGNVLINTLRAWLTWITLEMLNLFQVF